MSCSGDTRFDRVSNQLNQNNTIDFIQEFKQDHLCLVAGSTWPEDEAILGDYINTAPDNLKFIIAPHNIKPSQINAFVKTLNKKVVLFSEKANKELSAYQVLIIDTIGLLTKTYNYADLAYVGGAMGKTGLHNTLEAAVFGVPILIGPHYTKFPEAYEMIALGGMFSVADSAALKMCLDRLVNHSDERKNAGAINRNFIDQNKGAVNQIMAYLSNVK